MAVQFYDHQRDAIEKLQNGNILVGGVGTGKSRTALGYFCYKVCKSGLRDLYIITTAKKRDSFEWDEGKNNNGETILVRTDTGDYEGRA